MQKMTMQAFAENAYLAGVNADYLETLYETYLQNPQAVEPHWRDYFASLANGSGTSDVSHDAIRKTFRQLSQQPVVAVTSDNAQQAAVSRLIQAYRRFGHLNAVINPLGVERPADSRLQLSNYGLTDADLSHRFDSQGVFAGKETLKNIYEKLRTAYCGSIGIEYSTIADEAEREWLQDYIEQRLPIQYDAQTKKVILQNLIASETLEKYLDMKYVGQKRFSIEGADSLIPMLDLLAQGACRYGIREMVIGMAHRGRLNVLLNIMGHPPKELFLEFEGKKEYGMTSGDVKYHRGYSRDVLTPAGALHLALAFNPSHLEFINPVIMGSVRARQDYHSDDSSKRFDYAMPVQIHGDAAFAGQGIVMETLSMSQTRAHAVGGSVHIIVNNQVGFTTSNPKDARSSLYCSDLAKMLDAPIFHVNGDDAEACVAVTQLALDYRMRFHKDIVIDLMCYRRHGHQEVDEPTATQPLMYQIIKKHPTTKTLYAEQLQKQCIVSAEEVEAMVNAYRDKLDQGEQVVETVPEGLSKSYSTNWAQYVGQESTAALRDDKLDENTLLELANKIATFPEEFQLQRQVNSLMAARKKMALGEIEMDWGFAENLAYATLLIAGHPVRLVGEDCRRGTFYHRHAVLHDQKTGSEYMPLVNLRDTQARVQIYDSLLSEAAALGFEYGYSTARPNSLIIWEAQFGDFANGAQVIIDQFISSGCQKWNRLSGLVLLLPHGYEGMGPEHSSARLERYLQLCAQHNLQVCVPTTPAQIYHLLRRQVLRPLRKPLIVMSPKSLLRHKLATSKLDDLLKGQFQLFIPEIDKLDDNKVTRVILCSGKVYYDLLEARRENKIDNAAIIRIEQLYPFPYEGIKEQLKRYKNAKVVVWCQEEPKNQGAWFTGRHRLIECLDKHQDLVYAGREPSAAPAVGYPALHKKQQEALVNEALSIKV